MQNQIAKRDTEAIIHMVSKIKYIFKNRNVAAFDIVDFHSHILPKADHGSESVDVSLWQLKSASKHGIRRIIATPHFYPHRDSVDTFLKRRNSAFDKLQSSIGDLDIEIKLGAEVLLCQGIERLPELEKLLLTGTNILLAELPNADMLQDICKSVKNIIDSGIRIVLAHPERYEISIVENLLDVGVKLQLNASAVTQRRWSSDIQRWLKTGAVVAIGSDIHKKNKKAYKAFCRATAYTDIEHIKNTSDELWDSSEKR